jgi:hypothetical protein
VCVCVRVRACVCKGRKCNMIGFWKSAHVFSCVRFYVLYVIFFHCKALRAIRLSAIEAALLLILLKAQVTV